MWPIVAGKAATPSVSNIVSGSIPPKSGNRLGQRRTFLVLGAWPAPYLAPVVERPEMDVEAINRFLQTELRKRERDSVPAVEAARWLDGAGVLRDSEQRRGRPLRDLLRAGLITGQRQEPTSRWFIDRVRRS